MTNIGFKKDYSYNDCKQAYYEWRNDYLTYGLFAEHRSISVSDASSLLTIGRSIAVHGLVVENPDSVAITCDFVLY